LGCAFQRQSLRVSAHKNSLRTKLNETRNLNELMVRPFRRFRVALVFELTINQLLKSSFH
jgi:hypothetical protein